MLVLHLRVYLPAALRRKVNMLAKLAGFLLLLLTFGAVQANADSIYEVIGTLTIPGNYLNPGVGETINFSFEFDSSLPNGIDLIGTPIITAFGPLGTFTTNGSDHANSYNAFVASGNGVNSGVEIDLDSEWFADQSLKPVFSSEMWSCFLPVCAEFWPAPVGPTLIPGPTGYGLMWPGTATAAVSIVPEPGTLCLSVLGALSLCLMQLGRRLPRKDSTTVPS